MAADADSLYIAYSLNDGNRVTTWFNSTALNWSNTYSDNIYIGSMSILSNGDLAYVIYSG